ncbi:hypothetical protein EJ05DRAFT_526375 [Pseudovirgaria hyperparasitica]|uniref:Uncharacterized protein n=1 Tax=Pseudovirgaria hyperparasitica TaxID=470096 RepID=A0A6A6WAG1_9PEZI|nr:uncharacterized protein EJ05DRAFT_526375 [Pseudovirgaria hyperparasitica]KAF2759663.1 hypothetical protein EJ05DRAFT_526375 [Pseudovirgaria hyperparasitica]
MVKLALNSQGLIYGMDCASECPLAPHTCSKARIRFRDTAFATPRSRRHGVPQCRSIALQTRAGREEERDLSLKIRQGCGGSLTGGQGLSLDARIVGRRLQDPAAERKLLSQCNVSWNGVSLARGWQGGRSGQSRDGNGSRQVMSTAPTDIVQLAAMALVTGTTPRSRSWAAPARHQQGHGISQRACRCSTRGKA